MFHICQLEAEDRVKVKLFVFENGLYKITMFQMLSFQNYSF